MLDHLRLREFMAGFDLDSGCLTSNLGFYAMRIAIDMGVNLVDTNFMSENPLDLYELVVEKSISGVHNYGDALGLSHILIGH